MENFAAERGGTDMQMESSYRSICGSFDSIVAIAVSLLSGMKELLSWRLTEEVFLSSKER